MKKMFTLLLALTLVISLAACGGKSGENSSDKQLMEDLQSAVDGKTGGETGEQQSGKESKNAAAPVLLVNDSVSAYSQAYNNYSAVYTAMDDTYHGLLDQHNAAIEAEKEDYWDDPNHFTDIVWNFVNVSAAYTATFGDSDYEVGVAALFEMLGITDGKVEEMDASNYRMTYTATGYTDPETWETHENVPYEDLCGFDADAGALYFREYVTINGDRKLVSFIEFVPLGGGRYALQSEKERGIVEVINGEAVSYEYAGYSIPFDAEADSIFPKASGVDSAWILAGSEMKHHITLDSKNLHIWAEAITEGILPMPERDIVIAR